MISVLISVYAGETAENLRGAIHSTYNSLSLLDNQLEREIVLVKDGPLCLIISRSHLYENFI